MKRLLLELGRQGRVHRVRRRQARRRRGVHRLHMELSLGPDLHRPHPGHRATRRLRPRSSRCSGGTPARSKVGDPTELDTIVGPLISAAQRDRVEGHIATGRAEGARLVAGGGRPSHMERGFYVEPTLFVADNDMAVARREIFGPVLVVIPFDDEAEAVAIANDSDFGLYDYVFSADTARAFEVAQQSARRTRGHQHRPAQPRGPLRRVQDVGRGARRGRLRPGGVLGAAVDRVDRLRLVDHRRKAG